MCVRVRARACVCVCRISFVSQAERSCFSRTSGIDITHAAEGVQRQRRGAEAARPSGEDGRLILTSAAAARREGSRSSNLILGTQQELLGSEPLLTKTSGNDGASPERKKRQRGSVNSSYPPFLLRLSRYFGSAPPKSIQARSDVVLLFKQEEFPRLVSGLITSHHLQVSTSP